MFSEAHEHGGVIHDHSQAHEHDEELHHDAAWRKEINDAIDALEARFSLTPTLRHCVGRRLGIRVVIWGLRWIILMFHPRWAAIGGQQWTID